MTNSIQWDNLSNLLVQRDIEALPLEKLGIEIQKLYYEIVISEEAEETATDDLMPLIAGAVEASAKEEAEWLSATYEQGILPRNSKAASVASEFLSRLGRQFRRALCVEARESRKLALSVREIVVLLVPTVATILGLPPEKAALAVPLSIVLCKVSVNAFCEGVDEDIEREAFEREQLKIARKTVLFLQKEIGRYRKAPPPPMLQEALEQAALRLSTLEGGARLIESGQPKERAVSPPRRRPTQRQKRTPDDAR